MVSTSFQGEEEGTPSGRWPSDGGRWDEVLKHSCAGVGGPRSRQPLGLQDRWGSRSWPCGIPAQRWAKLLMTVKEDVMDSLRVSRGRA